ncbi:MAG: SdpA family antimicrobial peptide system protein [Nannocystaceae bacterium]|nr:SdpA family antimicrobial peptide system protein [bacterium]
MAAWALPWAALVWWVLINALPHNPQSPGRTEEHQTRLALPEGWGFFTRDPREPDLILVRRASGGDWSIEPPHASAKNLMGLDRTSRAYPVETIRLLEDVRAGFVECEQRWDACLSAAPVHVVHNRRAEPVLCGDLGLLRRAPPPWAWAHLMSREDMPTSALRMEVVCDVQS